MSASRYLANGARYDCSRLLALGHRPEVDLASAPGFSLASDTF